MADTLKPAGGLGAGRTADVDGPSLVIGSVAIMLRKTENQPAPKTVAAATKARAGLKPRMCN